MAVGGSVQVEVRVLRSDGVDVTPPGPPTYTSRNPATVLVDQSGVVTGLAPGATYLIAETVVNTTPLKDSLQVQTSCTLELRVEMTPTQKTLTIGTGFLPAVKLLSCGGHMTLTDTFTWTASDPSILSVDPSSGATTALKTGVASVRARGAQYKTLTEIPVTVQ